MDAAVAARRDFRGSGAMVVPPLSWLVASEAAAAGTAPPAASGGAPASASARRGLPVAGVQSPASKMQIDQKVPLHSPALPGSAAVM